MRERYRNGDKLSRASKRDDAIRTDVLHAITPHDLHYIAGIVDGEGFIGIVRHPTKLAPEVRISMTSLPVLVWLASQLGTVVVRATVSPRLNRKPQWIVVLTGRRAILLASILRTLLRVKHKQAQILHDFGMTYGRLDGSFLTKEVQSQREALCRSIRFLNKRGFVTGPRV